MLEARTGRWAVAVKISIRQLREQLTDFIACGHIQGFLTLRTGVEAFRWGALGIDDLMGVKEHVEIFHLATFLAENGMVIHQ